MRTRTFVKTLIYLLKKKEKWKVEEILHLQFQIILFHGPLSFKFDWNSFHGPIGFKQYWQRQALGQSSLPPDQADVHRSWLSKRPRSKWRNFSEKLSGCPKRRSRANLVPCDLPKRRSRANLAPARHSKRDSNANLELPGLTWRHEASKMTCHGHRNARFSWNNPKLLHLQPSCSAWIALHFTELFQIFCKCYQTAVPTKCHRRWISTGAL